MPATGEASVHMSSPTTTSPVRELPVIAGHLALDFTNTIDDPQGGPRHDHIATYDGLLLWSVRAGILSPARGNHLRRDVGPTEATRAVRRAHRMRDTLTDAFVDLASGGRTIKPRHWVLLKSFVADALDHADLAPDGAGLRLRWSRTDSAHAMLWPIAQASVDLLTTVDVHRIKRCAGCDWLFLDRSRNRSRRWCAMDDCGTQAKMRRYIARRATLRSPAQPSR